MTQRFILIIIGLISSGMLWAQKNSGGSMHGTIVGDYYYKASGDSKAFGDANSQYNSGIPRDFQAFEIRRLHLFYDYTISEKFFTRFQLEGNNKSLDPGGRQGIYVKTAYAEWRDIFQGSNLLAGIVPTPTWSFVENVWGYRSIEKSIADARNLGAGSDMGMLLRGTLPTTLPIRYAVMIGNGNAQKPEDDKYKKFYGMINCEPTEDFFVEFYADYRPSSIHNDIVTFKTTAAYQTDAFVAGTEIVQQTFRYQFAPASHPAEAAVLGISLFTWYKTTDEYKFFVRADYYDPNRYRASQGFYELFFSFGLDYTPVKEIHIMPNVWIMTFTDKSSQNIRKEMDIVPRLTFNFTFQ